MANCDKCIHYHCTCGMSWHYNNSRLMCDKFINSDWYNLMMKEKENNMVDRRTKADLIAELESKEQEIVELKEQIKNTQMYEAGLEGGKQISEFIAGMVDGGLTRKEALSLLGIILPTLALK